MKPNRQNKAVVIALAASAVLLSGVQAATVVTPYLNTTDGDVTDESFFYTAKITFATTDTWSGETTPGAWSFRDLKPAANPNRGWGHTSDWYLVEITVPTNFTIAMASGDLNAQPGFVIYAGETIIDRPGNAHTYSNNGNDLVLLNDGWDDNGPAGSLGLTYVGNGFAGSTSSLSGTYFLQPGLYTVVLGNAADSLNAPAAVTYDFAFTVPEPSAALLGAAGLLLAVGRRRRA